MEKVHQLVLFEKYDKALELLQEKLESKRDTDEVISRLPPRRERIFRTSEDRNRILWAEDNRIIFRDILNPIVKTKTLPEPPQDFQVSANGEYITVSLVLKNTKGCRIKAYSMLDDSLEYESGAHISCRNKVSITNDGKYLYYFIDENIYREETKNPRKPRLIIDSSRILPPFPKLKNKYSIVPIGNHFVVFSGIAGSYNLYFFDSEKSSIELISSEILSPKTFYSHGTSLFVVTGKIGSWYLRELVYKDERKPRLTTGFAITSREREPWKMTGPNEFLSFYNNSVFLWGPLIPRKELPLLCERGWGIGMDMIVYENKEGELILSDTAYTEEEWAVLELYREVHKKARL